MVREIRLEVEFSLHTPQEFFDAIFAEEEGLKIFHKLNSTEEGAQVTPWVKGERTISFYKEMELPPAVAYLFGTSKIPVEERQKLEWKEDGSFTIFSDPQVQINTGYKFTGTTEMIVEPNNQGSKLTAIIRCTANGPYGLIGFIESSMEKEAKKGIELFFTFCETRMAEKKADRLLRSEADSESLPFYDVHYESLSQCSIPDTNNNGNVLTTEAIILTRIKQLEEEFKISQKGLEEVTKKVEGLELALMKSRRRTVIACTALSIVLVTTVVLLKRYPTTY